MDSPITDFLLHNEDELLLDLASPPDRITIGHQFINEVVQPQIPPQIRHSPARTAIEQVEQAGSRSAPDTFEDLILRPYDLESCKLPAYFLKKLDERLALITAIKKCERRGYQFILDDHWWENNRIYWLTLLHFRMHLPKTGNRANRFRLLLTNNFKPITLFDHDNLIVIWMFKTTKTQNLPYQSLKMFQEEPALIPKF